MNHGGPRARVRIAAALLGAGLAASLGAGCSSRCTPPPAGQAMTSPAGESSWSVLDLRGARRGRALIDELVAAPRFAEVRELDLSGCELGDDGVRALLASPRLPPLTSLTLRDNRIGPAGAAALATDTRLASLTTLRLGDNPVGDAGVAALTASTPLRGLRVLEVRGAEVTADSARALAAGLPALRELDLGNNQLGTAGVEALLAPRDDGAPRPWTALVLAGNRIGAGAARSLVAASLPALRSLDLRDNQLGADGVRALPGAMLAGLDVLDLSENRTGDAAAELLARAPRLVRLGLAGDQLTAAGVTALAAAGAPALRELDLSRNALGAAGARALAEAGWLPRLTRLDATETDLGDAELALLAPRLTAVETLALGANRIADPTPLASLGRLASIDLSESAIDLARFADVLGACGPALVELRLAAIPGGASGLAALTGAPLRRLQRLDLAGWALGDDGARALATAAARWPALAELDLGRNQLTDAGASTLAATSNLGALATLALPGNRIGEAGARALVASNRLPALTRIDLRHNPVRSADLTASRLRLVVELSGDTPARAPAALERDEPPAAAPAVPDADAATTLDRSRRALDPALLAEIDAALAGGRIHGLRLTGAKLDAAGVRALFGLAHAKALEVLDLSANPLGDDGARAVAQAAPAGLRELSLSACSIGDDGVRALAAAQLSRLERLDLADNDLGPTSVRRLAAGSFAASVLELTLSGNRLGDDGARALGTGKLHPVKLGLRDAELSATGLRALLAGRAVERLQFLELSGNPLGSEGGKALAAFAGAGALQGLTLARTQLGDAGLRALLSAPLTRLVALDLAESHLGDAGARALAASDKLRQLRVLDLRDNDLGGSTIEALRQRFGDRVALPPR